jgi:choline monooxygenase
MTAALASALPADAYVAPEFFDRECRRLFPGTWVFVGFVHELATPGDVVPVEVGKAPILLVNGGSNGIKAFHNVCRHRCAMLVEAPGNVGRFLRCPYHCWTYDLDGTLRRTPHFAGPNEDRPDDFSLADHGLIPARMAIWHDWIFVNLDGEAMAFEDYAQALFARLDDIPLSTLTPVGTVDFGEVAANWKALMENFIEPYHVQFVHASSTRQPLTDHSTFIDGFCIGSAVEVSGRRTDADPAGTVDRLEVSSRYVTLFPNFVLGWYEPDQLGVHLNVPLGAGATRQRRVLYHIGEGGWDRQKVESLRRLWRTVHQEDHAICERLQRGRMSPAAAAGGVLSPHWEGCIRQFQDLVNEAVAG